MKQRTTQIHSKLYFARLIVMNVDLENILQACHGKQYHSTIDKQRINFLPNLGYLEFLPYWFLMLMVLLLQRMVEQQFHPIPKESISPGNQETYLTFSVVLLW